MFMKRMFFLFHKEVIVRGWDLCNEAKKIWDVFEGVGKKSLNSLF